MYLGNSLEVFDEEVNYFSFINTSLVSFTYTSSFELDSNMAVKNKSRKRHTLASQNKSQRQKENKYLGRKKI